jgi:hypothetical protein
MRMSRMKEKPDLAAWSRSMHTLIREGIAPTDEPTRSEQARESHARQEVLERATSKHKDEST